MSENDYPILIVDDNEDNRYMLSRRLNREGCSNLSMAENGQEALEILTKKPFDLVFLDIMMPVMNGYETLEHIKADTALRDVPVIMISALDELDSVVKCIKLGAEDYLPKPFSPVLLQARVGACLEKKKTSGSRDLHLDMLEAEKARADDLLRAILPPGAVRELKETK